MRARQLKPSFFCDEEIASLPFEWRLLRAGLDLLADRAGRLRDSPRQIRGELFRFDNSIDVDAGLSALARVGEIVRYAAGDDLYIEISDFQQTPAAKEKPSAIPDHCSDGAFVIEDHNCARTDPLPAQKSHNTSSKPDPVPMNGHAQVVLRLFLAEHAASSTATRSAG